ncbi:hypothetical protein [Pseudoalteromonas ardens]|uniref:hypothetical protein n=1 Tax=Pseudoalteromonas ardens TaxID=3048490 RepID=UPI0024C326F1|nr:hypothetical protein [Pseudoalteromonas sp. R96]MDK1310176.1 hypothetical protein [Pseudoalteromonas sp. R96]
MTEEQWNKAILDSGSDPDLVYAKSVFYNQTDEVIFGRFRANFIERADELRFMPPLLFNAYLGYFTRYLTEHEHLDDDKPSLADCFTTLLEEKLADRVSFEDPLWHKCREAVTFLLQSPGEYTGDPDIYVNLPERLNRLEKTFSSGSTE